LKTERGRVVYNRKIHFFSQKDLKRVLRAVRREGPLREYVKMVINSFLNSVETIEQDFVPAFNYSLESFFEWVTTGVNPEARGLLLKPPPFESYVEEFSADQTDETKKDRLAGMTASMINIIERIKNYVKQEEL